MIRRKKLKRAYVSAADYLRITLRWMIAQNQVRWQEEPLIVALFVSHPTLGFKFNQFNGLILSPRNTYKSIRRWLDLFLAHRTF